jgi:hypothetical protein
MASYDTASQTCTYIPHFSMKSLNLKEMLMQSTGITTYVMECRGDVDTNVLMNGDPFTQSTYGWTVTSSCPVSKSLGLADYRVMPSAFKSQEAGFQYMWMAQGRKKN